MMNVIKKIVRGMTQIIKTFFEQGYNVINKD